MRRFVGTIIVLTSFASSGFAFGASSYLKYMDIWPANYTEDDIRDFHLEAESGKDLVVRGYDVKAFSRGGSSSPACCADLPGVGAIVRVVWRTGDKHESEANWVVHRGTTKIKGTTSDASNVGTFLIVRFFVNDQVEAEYVTRSDDVYSPLSPRIDEVLRGEKIMRQPGE